MLTETVAGALVVVGAALMLAGARWHWRPSLPVSLVACLWLQVLMVLVAGNDTPDDVARVFQWIGLTIRDGQDPVTTLPSGFWNFLPLAAWMHAGATMLPLPWTIAGKIGPLIANLVLVWLVGLLSRPEVAPLRQWQWAVNPVALLVVGWHGQIESVALMFGVGALVAARRHRLILAGVLLGLGVATKTWPVVFAVGLLLERPRWSRFASIGGGAFAAALAIGITTPLFLEVDLLAHLRAVAGYRSVVSALWGWSGGLYLVEPFQTRGGVVSEVGSLLFLVGVAVTAWKMRGRDAAAVTLAVLLMFFMVNAGIGVQYLFWPVPLLIALPSVWGWCFYAISVVYCALSYLPGADDLQLGSARHVALLCLSAAGVVAATQGWLTLTDSAYPRPGAVATRLGGLVVKRNLRRSRAAVPHPDRTLRG